jgi:hypothetical protein
VAIWYLSPVLVYCVKKNLATLVVSRENQAMVIVEMASHLNTYILAHHCHYLEPIFRPFSAENSPAIVTQKYCLGQWKFSAEKSIFKSFSLEILGKFGRK